MKYLSLVPVLALTTLGQSVDVISASSTVQTRSYLLAAKPNFIIEGGTNMVCDSILFIAVTERKIGTNNWVRVSEENRLITKTMATSWPDNYTNAQGTVVTNLIKSGVLADFGRADLLPPRWRNMMLVPQATAIPAE